MSLQKTDDTTRTEPCESVRVLTHARLHFGFFDPSGRGAKPFGSFGLGLNRPTTLLNLKRSATSRAEGLESGRGGQYLDKLGKAFGGSGAYDLTISRAIPRHAGLGSGTQLALAVGSAFARLEGKPLSLEDIAGTLGRGDRSGIGIGTFAAGGVVIDDGSAPGALPPILARADFPEDWRVLMIFDPSESGLHGKSEVRAFSEAPAFSDEETRELRHRALKVALPALHRQDFAAFAGEVGRLQEVMERYFGPFQGGPQVSPAVGEAISWLRSQGLAGSGQSSWGPTGFALIGSAAEGSRLLDEAKARDRSGRLRYELVSGLNRGASIEAS